MSEEKLNNLPGLQPVRLELLSSALSFYEEFVKDNAEDPELRFELADAYRQISDVQSCLGDYTLARENSLKAYELFEQLRNEGPEDDEVLRKIAWMNHVQLGRLNEALSIYRDLLSRHEDDEEILLGLAQTLQDKSSHDRRKSSIEEMRESLLEAESLVRHVLEISPGSERARNKLAFIFNTLGANEIRAKNIEEAMKYFEASAEVGMAQFEQTPFAIHLGRQTVTACANLAGNHAVRGNPDEALEWRKRQVKVARSLAYANPHVPIVWPELYNAWSELAREQEKVGDSDDARRSLWRAADILVNLQGQSFKDRLFLASVYADLSRLTVDDLEAQSATDRKHFRKLCVSTLRDALSMPEEVRVGVSHQELQDLAIQLVLDEDVDDVTLAIAESASREATRVTPYHGAHAYAVLSLVQHRRGKKDDAATSIAEALNRKADSPFALVVAAKIAHEQGDKEAEQRYLAKLDEIKPATSTDEYFLALWSELQRDKRLAARGNIDEEE